MALADVPSEQRIADFERAIRHSRRVRRLRYLLPILSLLVAVGVIGAGIVARIDFSLGIGKLDISADGLKMDAPKLSGSDGKGRTYEVTAKSALQDFSNPKVIQLFGIEATIHQADGSWATFEAGSGVYDSGQDTLDLQKDIRIRTNDNNTADLSKATIDLKTGMVDSDAPVDFSSALGSVSAKTMSVDQKGGAVHFGNGVKMTINPNELKSGDPISGITTDTAPVKEGSPANAGND